MNNWFINLNWDRNIEIWVNCRNHGLAAIGWRDDSEEDLSDDSRFQKARARLVQMRPGDRIVAFLKDRRLGGWGTITKAYDPKVFDPQLCAGTKNPDFGRVVHVDWGAKNNPPLGMAARMKREEMFGFDFLCTTSPLKAAAFERLRGIVEDKSRWESIAELAEERGTDDQTSELENALSDEPASPLREEALRRILANDLDQLEPGLKPFDKEHGPEEFDVHGAGRIDLFCVDAQGNPVVVELKRDKPTDQAVGQLARYMGYVKRHYLKSQQIVRGILVSHEIDERLSLAMEALAGAELKTYDVTVSITAHKNSENKSPKRIK